jgi:type I restriction-modification system DNA methylase subunit
MYEYFLGNFALSEGQGGGEFFTPRSVVRLMVEIIEPTKGIIFDPACGSGGIFVQAAQFLREQQAENNNLNQNLNQGVATLRSGFSLTEGIKINKSYHCNSFQSQYTVMTR